jgi:hypothetical protein
MLQQTQQALNLLQQ